MKIRLWFLLMIIVGSMHIVQAEPQPPCSSDKSNCSGLTIDTSLILQDLNKCKEHYDSLMMSRFESYKILPLTTPKDKQDACNFIDTKAFASTIDKVSSLYGANEDIERYYTEMYGNSIKRDCTKFLSTNIIQNMCINNNDLTMIQYHAVLSAYRYCAMDHVINGNSNNQTIADVITLEKNIVRWVEDEILDSQLRLDIGLTVMEEERKAASMIEPICHLLENVNEIREIALNLRVKLMEWIPLIPKRQLQCSQ